MVGILIISHGSLPEALISSVQLVVGSFPRIDGIALLEQEGSQSLKSRIREKLAHLDEGDGVLILTDILGGTPTNLSLSVIDYEKVDVVTGVNFPMLLALASHRNERSLEKLTRIVIRSGRKSITSAKKLFAPRPARSVRRAISSSAGKILSLENSARMSPPETATPSPSVQRRRGSSLASPATKKV